MKNHVQVVIPAFNEVDSLENVLEALPREVRGIAVDALVVDDGSTDGTSKLAKQMDIETISLRHNRGQGMAISVGLKIAAERGCLVCVCLDGDGQHDPMELRDVIDPILNNHADFVIGSRFIGSNFSDDNERILGIRFLALLMSVMLWQRLTDPTNGYRAFRGGVLPYLRTLDEEFNALELLVRARKSGLRIAEVPVKVRKRVAGQTKKPRFLYFLGLLRALFLGLVSQNLPPSHSGRTLPDPVEQ